MRPVLLIALIVQALSCQERVQMDPSFDGEWSWYSSGRESDFHISARQTGTALAGKLTGTSQHGARVTLGDFEGIVKGVEASIAFKTGTSRDKRRARGTARMRLQNGELHWLMDYSGDQEIWFPDEATLTRAP
jgi:hypothetical protein